ncbi:hypothetical protein HDK77DRAFT_450511 [Phyllosticta capitalensis]
MHGARRSFILSMTVFHLCVFSKTSSGGFNPLSARVMCPLTSRSAYRLAISVLCDIGSWGPSCAVILLGMFGHLATGSVEGFIGEGNNTTPPAADAPTMWLFQRSDCL